MKKFILMALVAISIVISGCDNQTKQREIEKQRQEDSIRVAENVKKELAEKEAKERAAREEAEREAKTWTGASSESELRNKLMGTSWETTYDVLRYKVSFSNNEVNLLITDRDGRYGYKDNKTYDNYKTMSKGANIVVGFGDEENSETYQIGFVDSRAILFINGNQLGELNYMGK